MKVMKASFIAVLLGLFFLSFAEGAQNVVFEQLTDPRALASNFWCDPIVVTQPTEGQMQIVHPSVPDGLVLTFSKGENKVIQVVNSGEGTLRYVAYDPTQRRWTQDLEIRKGEEHHWHTENDCTICFSAW